MSSKSHRAKALAAQLEAGPSSNIGELVPPASLVKPKVKKSKSTKESIVGSSKKKGKSKEVVEDGDVEREALDAPQQDDDETTHGPAGESWGQDVEMEPSSGLIPTGQSANGNDDDDDDAAMLIDPTSHEQTSTTDKPTPVLKPSTTSSDFLPISQTAQNKALLKPEERRVPIPPHRMAPLKKEWVNIYGPLVEMMGLMVRMNVQKKSVEMKVSCLELFFHTSKSSLVPPITTTDCCDTERN